MSNLNNPLVSIIVPIYNVEKYIECCVNSIIEQTYANIEIILVDDGTPDNSGKIADKLAKDDARIKVIHKENGGVASARNAGLDTASGEFIVYVDSDDWITKDHVEHLMYLQSINDSDMCMTTEHYTSQDDIQDKKTEIQKISNIDAAVLLLSPKVVVGCYDKIYRRSWLISHNIRQNEKLFSGEGLNYIVTAAEHANHVTISNKKIYYYRRNVSESATTKFNIKMFTNNELSLDFLEKEKIVQSKDFDEMLNQFRVHLMISGIIAIINNNSIEQYNDEYKRWRRDVKCRGSILLKSKNVEFRYKVRIICAIYFPRIWAVLAKMKRNREFNHSV